MLTSRMATVEIQTENEEVWGLAFSHNGREVLGGSYSGGWFRRWQVEDGKETETVPSAPKGAVLAAATSKDGRWIVHGDGGVVVVRIATTWQPVFRVKEHAGRVDGIDISPDSTRFASVSADGTLRVFSITTGERLLGPIQHNDWLTAVKFSPSGEYLAAASCSSRVRVWDAHTGSRLCEIARSPMDNWSHSPIAWSGDSKRLFYVTSDGKVTCHDIFSSNALREWLLLIDDPGYCSLATNGRLIVCSTPVSLSFWDASTYSRIDPPIEVEGGIYGVALSHCDNYFAGGGRGKITLYTLRNILPKDVFVDPPSRLPLIQVSDAAFKPWIEGNLKSVEDILSREIVQHSNYHAFANRALVRTRLKQWDMAIEDANRSLSISPSAIGYIAHAIALLDQHEKRHALRTFDLAFCHCDASQKRFVLLLRAILLFVSGKRKDPVARVNDLISIADDSEKYDFCRVGGTDYDRLTSPLIFSPRSSELCTESETMLSAQFNPPSVPNIFLLPAMAFIL
ncbi:quinon protein alcohol dehydrogenase-like superfamily [Boletus edulis]|nr:quinon protein alcohol dehydrogenase-like superfamily [Boletus edulis]